MKALEPKTYKRTRTIYAIGKVAFVANPVSRSSWFKTHVAVVMVPCPQCKSPVGDLCKPSFGFHRGNTHEARQRAVRGKLVATPMVIVQKHAKESKH